MKKWILILMALCMMAAGWAVAEGAEPEYLGKPLADFTVETIDGGSFTLSEALKEKDLVVINLWATWCPPCEMEFPYLQKAYEQYQDRVALIALSTDPSDTTEKLTKYAEEHGLTFPIGNDSGVGLSDAFNVTGIPTTVAVDRFGNAALAESGAQISTQAFTAMFDFFLSEDYTETRTLDEFPKPDYPYAEQTELKLTNAEAREIIFEQTKEGALAEAFGTMPTFYIVNGDSATFTVAIGREISADTALVLCTGEGATYSAFALLDGPIETTVDSLERTGNEYTVIALLNQKTMEIYRLLTLCADEANADALEAGLKEYGAVTGYRYADGGERGAATEPEQDAAEEGGMARWEALFQDQDGQPVAGCIINFCTDTACSTVVSDENGLAVFEGAPDEYHLQVLKVPEGYSYDTNHEFSAGRNGGSVTIEVTRE